MTTSRSGNIQRSGENNRACSKEGAPFTAGGLYGHFDGGAEER